MELPAKNYLSLHYSCLGIDTKIWTYRSEFLARLWLFLHLYFPTYFVDVTCRDRSLCQPKLAEVPESTLCFIQLESHFRFTTIIYLLQTCIFPYVSQLHTSKGNICKVNKSEWEDKDEHHCPLQKSQKQMTSWQYTGVSCQKKTREGERIYFLSCRFLKVLTWFLKKFFFCLFVCGRDSGGRDLELLHVKSGEFRLPHLRKLQDILNWKLPLLTLGNLFYLSGISFRDVTDPL